MTDLNFPIKFDFNISTLANDFTATDNQGKTLAYVRQKMFKLKEDIVIYQDASKTKVNYTIKADKWLDFSTSYSFKDPQGKELGKVARKGWASLWKANYDIIDQHQKPQYKIQEENAWVKVMDGVLGEIPILGFFTGYLFNPTYKVMDPQGKVVMRLKKEPSFFGRKFTVSKVEETDADDDHRLMLSLMMLVLLERRRG
ncbi:hypothetical protein ACFQ1M_07330 [Sungkyunkwania multivorans]|uniref:Uncharacterized protein n=1 Tax=Sungkyunkwania multivorans TaxID=1173618 RepID=A0ABW3CXH6_9FLAO